jgi:hypothetical protein
MSRMGLVIFESPSLSRSRVESWTARDRGAKSGRNYRAGAEVVPVRTTRSAQPSYTVATLS